MLNVSPRTVLNWIKDGAIPYVELPSGPARRSEYRIPVQALLRSLAGNYDLAAEFKRADAAALDERDGDGGSGSRSPRPSGAPH
jgi:hypothetical protein